jgi:hypothetical protein
MSVHFSWVYCIFQVEILKTFFRDHTKAHILKKIFEKIKENVFGVLQIKIGYWEILLVP